MAGYFQPIFLTNSDARQLAHRRLRQLRTATPAAITGEVRAIQDLFGCLRYAAQRRERRLNLEPVLIRGCQAFPEIATWNRQVLIRLSSTGQLFLPARALSGDEVSEDHAVAGAKLHGRLVTAPTAE